MDNIPLKLQPYKNCLSFFGQNVLQVLANQWSLDKTYQKDTANEQSCLDINQNSGFRNTHKSSSDRNNLEKINNIGRKKCHLKFIGKEIPKSSILPLQLNFHNSEVLPSFTQETEQDIRSTDDLVTSAISLKTDQVHINNKNNSIEINEPKSIETNDKLGTKRVSTISKESSGGHGGNVITWNNMFDTELFKDINIDLDDTFNEKDESILFENKRVDHFKEAKLYVDVFKKPDAKNTKRKSLMKIVDQPLNKVKITEPTSKNVYRKEKFTKTVTNWLNDLEQTFVDVDNNMEEVSYTMKDKIIETTESDRTKKDLGAKKKQRRRANRVQLNQESTVESTCNKKENEDASPKICISNEKTKAKVVQAQLVNKDGKMKFKKPKESLIDDTKYEGSNASIQTNEVVKKNKSKFISPIKSQIPVKDITYNITTIEGNYYSGISFKNLENLDIFALLVYSNGYCQLNGCYTQDTCIPEGLLCFTANNDFYYFTKITESCGTLFSDFFERNMMTCYDGKSILIFLSRWNINLKPLSILDAKIGGALLDPDNPPETFSSLQKLVGFVPDFTVATDCSLQKAAWYCTLLRACADKLGEALVHNGLWNVFVNLEMRLLPIVAGMESRGVAVDMDKLKAMEQLLVTKLKAVEQECYKAAGRTFQINSGPQLRALLFDELKLDAKCNVTIRETLVKGAKSTSEATLRSLMGAHALPRLVLEYRHLHKAHATFVAGVAQHVKNGVVHPRWDQVATATGRIVSSNPNLQAIPKAPFSLVMFPQSDDVDNPSLNFRSVYVARPGHWLLAADFKHVECRVFAHAARDETLLAALQSDDLFRVLAAKWLNKSEGDVSNADRERTKRIVYASLYGCGARKLADLLDVGYEQALAVLASFNSTFPSLKSFGRGVVRECLRSGRLTTLCGRARSFKDITSQDFAARAHAERQAVNFVVQGSAADLCKMAMILTEERLRASSPPLRAHLVLQIHDELVWEVHDDDADRAAEAVRAGMQASGAGCGAALRLPVARARARRWPAARDSDGCLLD